MEEFIVSVMDRLLAPFKLVIRRKSTLEALELELQELRSSKSSLPTYAMRKYRSAWIQRNFIDGKDNSYHQTFSQFSQYIDADHQSYAELATEGVAIVTKIPGWLQMSEALKIYEMAYYAHGDILDLGTYEGLSSSIMVQACRNSGNGSKIYSVDICDQTKAKLHHENDGMGGVVNFLQGDAAQICREFIADNHRFSFVFVDHSHLYQDVVAVCELLDDLTLPEGYVLFHDFIHPANTDENEPHYEYYGVPHAVVDALPRYVFSYRALVGAAILYQKTKNVD